MHSIIDDRVAVIISSDLYIDVVVDSRKLITSATQGIEISRKRIGIYRLKIAIIHLDSPAK